MSDYPEHDKLKQVQERSQACGEFLEWLQDEKNLVLCHRPEFKSEEDAEDQEGEYFPAPVSKMRLLAEFFDIDLGKLEDEKRALLEAQRQLNEQAAREP